MTCEECRIRGASASSIHPRRALRRRGFRRLRRGLPATIEVGTRQAYARDSHEFETRRQQRDAGALSSLVSAEIIPRLMFAHRRAAPRAVLRAANGPRPMVFNADDVADFAQRLVASDERAAGQWVDALVEAGYSLDESLGTLFQPAARHLGMLWNRTPAASATSPSACCDCRTCFVHCCRASPRPATRRAPIGVCCSPPNPVTGTFLEFAWSGLLRARGLAGQ